MAGATTDDISIKECTWNAPFGGAKASVEVGINAQAVVVERDYGRPTLALLQALWSVRGLAGLPDECDPQSGHGDGPRPIWWRPGRGILWQTLCHSYQRNPDHCWLGSRSLSPDSFFAIAGLAVAGLGNSNLVPILLSLVALLGLITAVFGPAVIQSYAQFQVKV
jgi:hypothetical protein